MQEAFKKRKTLFLLKNFKELKKDPQTQATWFPLTPSSENKTKVKALSLNQTTNNFFNELLILITF